jgi:RNA polymerase sigma-70 factor (ECF subfamily)
VSLGFKSKSITDASLVAAVVEKQPNAARQFVLRVEGRVHRVASLICGDTDADDVTQAVLLQLFSSLARLNDPSTLDAWVDRIAVRISMRFVRRERRRHALLRRFWLPGYTPWGQATSVETQAQADLERRLLVLPPAERKAFVLRYVFEYTLAEVAEITSTPEGTLRHRLVRSRARLAKL